MKKCTGIFFFFPQCSTENLPNGHWIYLHMLIVKSEPSPIDMGIT